MSHGHPGASFGGQPVSSRMGNGLAFSQPAGFLRSQPTYGPRPMNNGAGGFARHNRYNRNNQNNQYDNRNDNRNRKNNKQSNQNGVLSGIRTGTVAHARNGNQVSRHKSVAMKGFNRADMRAQGLGFSNRRDNDQSHLQVPRWKQNQAQNQNPQNPQHQQDPQGNHQAPNQGRKRRGGRNRRNRKNVSIIALVDDHGADHICQSPQTSGFNHQQAINPFDPTQLENSNVDELPKNEIDMLDAPAFIEPDPDVDMPDAWPAEARPLVVNLTLYIGEEKKEFCFNDMRAEIERALTCM